MSSLRNLQSRAICSAKIRPSPSATPGHALDWTYVLTRQQGTAATRATSGKNLSGDSGWDRRFTRTRKNPDRGADNRCEAQDFMDGSTPMDFRIQIG